jgi:hypothetical protein
MRPSGEGLHVVLCLALLTRRVGHVSCIQWNAVPCSRVPCRLTRQSTQGLSITTDTVHACPGVQVAEGGGGHAH